METPLGSSAEDFYNQHSRDRTGPVQVGRRLADITIPSVFPPENWNHGDDLEITNQSANSLAVNTLASKLTTSALPPNLPMAKFSPVESRLADDIQADPEGWSEVQYALSRREESHRKRLETTLARSTYLTGMKLQLVTGNCLCLWIDIDTPRIYDMHQYVVKRDPSGDPIVTVLEESISAATAPNDVKDAVREVRASSSKEFNEDRWDEDITIYHVQVLSVDPETEEREWEYWQETEGGTKIADSEATSPFDVPTMYPAGLIRDTGSDWYLPYCGDYEGDLSAVETFAAALQDGAAALAWFLFFVNPSGNTNLKDVKEADSLDVLSGRADDVSTLRTDKGGDLSFVSREFEAAARRLGFAFAMHTAIQRPQERVTREEWQILARELDETLGGLYTQISQGWQRWFVLRFIHLHEMEDENLAEVPEGLVDIGIVTGLDSLGRSTDHANLMSWADDGQRILGPEAFAKSIHPEDFLRRLASHKAVKTEGLVKTSEQRAKDDQQAQEKLQQQSVMDNAAGPIAKEGAAAVAEMMKQQQGEAQNG